MYKPTKLSVSSISQGSGTNKIRILYFLFDGSELHVYPFLPFNDYWYLVQNSKQMRQRYEHPKSQRIEKIKVHKNDRNQRATT